jgi:NADH-quinone oxidoreductase subunit L
VTAAAWICLFLPLGSAAAITLLGTSIRRRTAGWIATLSCAGSFAAAVVTVVSMLGRQPEHRAEVSTAWTWLQAGNFRVGFSILTDPLSVFMMLVVAGVGSLIVLYSIGYMDGDDEERRYFAYMSLFVFSMLMLVQGGNLLLLLVGWGLVGLSSYLLIGFHHDRPSAVAAAKKAFIMNAFGDATMALAFFVLIQKTGTLDYGLAFQGAHGLSSTTLNLIALGLLGGAVAKSAQLPLQTWLPDAMEGPTPVSALIHAATMVTAGVYLIVRTHPLFELAPRVQDLAAGLGAATLLVAGLIALVQTDIKRVIAYSTMSQIGYMFLGAGLGAYANAMFHLLTHAFFKALLFLAAGLVIHALAGEQDMRRMGGLRGLMPRTWWAMLVGGLALAGLPPLSGFFSKDSILASALDRGWYGDVLFAAGMAGTFLTGLYTFRMLFIVFGGEPPDHVKEHPPHAHGDRTAQWSMGLAVAALAALAAVGGWIQFADRWSAVSNFLEPVAHPLVEATGTQEAVASVLAVVLGLAGIGVAWWIYSARRMAAPASWRVLERKFWFDELYNGLFYWPAVGLSRTLSFVVEGPLVGGSIAGVTGIARWAGGRVRDLQTGLVRTYVFALAAGLAVLVFVFVVVK